LADEPFAGYEGNVDPLFFVVKNKLAYLRLTICCSATNMLGLFSDGNMAPGSQSSIEQVCETIISLELGFVSIRSKFGRDESKQYELVAYKPIAPILQEGPQ
jgi:hypothetical protein